MTPTPTDVSPTERIESWLKSRLSSDALAWLAGARDEVARGAGAERFCALLSTASRHARPRPLDLDSAEVEAAAKQVAGWNPERWNLLEAARVTLILALPDLAGEAAGTAIEEAYRYADEGETCALSRALALLPKGERFVWRAGECCRTNMVSVFEATALDTPYPAARFDEHTFNQAAIKTLFIGSPLWRLHGLDERLGPELAEIALDLAEERRSAHRPVQHELWLCLGTHGGARAAASLEAELTGDFELGRRAAAYGMVRAGLSARLEELLRSAPAGDPVHDAARDALAGNTSQRAFRALDPS